MSTTDNGSSRTSVKTLAIRLEPDLHAQLSLIAQLRGHTITDEIRQAIEAHLAAAKDAPELADRASSALDAIDRDALARREAITALFGGSHPATPEPGTRGGSSRRSGRGSGSSAS